MSQEFNLTGLSITPSELDELERNFEESEAWDDWINYTRDIAQNQPEDQARAVWRRLIKRFEAIVENIEDRNIPLASDLTFLCGQIWSKELASITLYVYVRRAASPMAC